MSMQLTGLRSGSKSTVKADDKGINWRYCRARNMPTLNPNLDLKQNIYKGRNEMLIARLKNDVSEIYYPSTNTLVVYYYSKGQKDPIKRQRLFLKDQSLETKFRNQLKKKEYLSSTEEKPIYYNNTFYDDKGQEKEKTLYKVYNNKEDDVTQVVDTTKNTRKEFRNAEGKVIVYKDGKEIKTLPKEESNITRAVQYDGTQVKEVKLDALEEKLRITKELGPHRKTAEVIMADGQIKSLFRKNYTTRQREINPGLSKFLPQEAREEILSQKQKFSETAKKLIIWLKEYKLLK